MERSTQLWIGMALLAALAGAVYKVSKADAPKGGATSTTSADLPDLKASDDVDKISIVNAEKGEVVLEKKSSPGAGPEAKWEVTKPVHAPANQANIKQLLDNMK